MYFSRADKRILVVGFLAASSLMAVLVFWAETYPTSLHAVTHEDGPIENASAAFLFLSSIAFVVCAVRSTFIKGHWLRYVPVGGLAALMFVGCGEEISWGQRILGFETPAGIKEANLQQEFNFHNLSAFDSQFFYAMARPITLFMLVFGLLMPFVALFEWGRNFARHFALPVAPLCYSFFFLASYGFGKYYTDTLAGRNDAGEVRELLFAFAMFLVGLHAAMRPGDIFRDRIADE